MDLRELNQHLELRRRLTKAEQLRDALRAAAEPGAQIITGMPHTPGYRDRLGNLAAEIADVSAEIETVQNFIQQQETAIIPFISAIPDGYTRMIFRLRFLRGMGWAKIAKTIGGKNNAHNVRNVCYRYFKQDNRKSEKS